MEDNNMKEEEKEERMDGTEDTEDQEIGGDEERLLLEGDQEQKKVLKRRKTSVNSEISTDVDSSASSENEAEKTIVETETGDKRDRDGEKKKKKGAGKRSVEAKLARKEKAKLRRKRNKAIKKLAAVSLQEQRAATGEGQPPPGGKPTPSKDQTGKTGKSGSGKERITPHSKGSGESSPKPPPSKKRSGKVKKENQTPKGDGGPSKPPAKKKQRSARPSGTPHHVYIRLNGVAMATEEQRRSVMEDLAIRLALRPTTSINDNIPFIVNCIVLPNGSIRLSGNNVEAAQTFRTLLSERDDLSFLEGPETLRRFVFGAPGYFNNMELDVIRRLLENQNPGLPRDGIQITSVDRTGKAPRFFVEVSDEVHAYLVGVEFKLDTATCPIILRPVGGKKEKTSE